MRRTLCRIAAALAAAALICGMAVFANCLVGNPISKLLAWRTAEDYLARQYPDTDYALEEIRFDFKSTCYRVTVKAPNSLDRHFSLRLGMDGRLLYDDYDYRVTRGENTARRIEESYRALADTVLENPNFTLFGESGFGFGTLFPDEEGAGAEGSTSLRDMAFEPDQLVDIHALGGQVGQLVIYARGGTVTVERAAAMLLEIREMMDAGGVPFATVHFVLEHELPAEGVPRPEGRVETLAFPCADIYAAGLEERVERANQAAEDFYARLDEEKSQQGRA